MNLELKALHRNKTWEIVDLPPNRKAIGCKWVYKIKYKSTGEIERYKARLVAKGFSQKEGIDFFETFSLVVKMVIVRCVLSMVVHFNWEIYQFDINNAFLYGDLNEEVYMCLPDGYNSSYGSTVCKLKKSLYGLKQAPRMWNEKLVSVLVDLGFEQSKCDHSMFVMTKDSTFIVLLVYVDGIIITGSCSKRVDEIKLSLKSKFLIKDLGKLQYFLGKEFYWFVFNTKEIMFRFTCWIW
ncbi:putative RNA-directed DNA polymerase [Helianthus annuus]|nr:putative RNA-directed DNA polymerase [Helianthus annuus]